MMTISPYPDNQDDQARMEPGLILSARPLRQVRIGGERRLELWEVHSGCARLLVRIFRHALATDPNRAEGPQGQHVRSMPMVGGFHHEYHQKKGLLNVGRIYCGAQVTFSDTSPVQV
jgi:hypothetical protein